MVESDKYSVLMCIKPTPTLTEFKIYKGHRELQSNGWVWVVRNDNGDQIRVSKERMTITTDGLLTLVVPLLVHEDFSTFSRRCKYNKNTWCGIKRKRNVCAVLACPRLKARNK
jgi:hypothetical protein